MFRRLAVGLSALSLLGFVVIVPGPQPVRAGGACTAWSNDRLPPTSIRVLRTLGRAVGTVQTVPFQRYVETTLAGEFGSTAPPEVLRVGAIIVKQYAWYFAMHWRGGSAGGHCFDVVDNTNDQLYWPSMHRPTSEEIQAVRDTWTISLRKWDQFFPTAYRRGSSVACGANADGWRLYQHSAYRCAANGDLWPQILRTYFDPGLRIVRPGAHDLSGNGTGDIAVITPTAAGQSGAAAETVGAVLGATSGSVPGPLASPDPTPAPGPSPSPDPSPGPAPSSSPEPSPAASNPPVDAVTATAVSADAPQLLSASIYPDARPPASSGATSPSPLLVASNQVLGLAVGDVNGNGRDDLLTLQRTPAGDVRLLVSLSTGKGFAPPAVWWDSRTAGIDLPASAAIDLVAGDFNGDGLADAALLVGRPAPSPAGGGTSTASPAKLYVLLSQGSRFDALSTWWSGQLDMTQAKAFAVDVDGDGKADLVVEEPILGASGPSVTPAPSAAGQESPSPSGAGVTSAVGTRFLVFRSRTGPGLADPATWAVLPRTPPDRTKVVASDVDGDGFGDLVVDVRLTGDGSRMIGLISNGRRFAPRTLWQSSDGFSWDASKLAAADLNGDGRGDVVVLYDLGSGGTGIYQFLSTGSALRPGSRMTDPTLVWASARPC